MPFTRNLRFRLPMMSGPDVKALQTRLFERGFGKRTDIDGLFGPGTRATVKAFQSICNIDIDGIAGPILFGQLNNAALPPPFGAAQARSASHVLPPDWMPDASMKRIILHWTAGTHTPSKNDKKHYHILIDGAGIPHRGGHGINANVPPLRTKPYAAHTRGTNSHSIGVSVCCMMNAQEVPFDPGPFPMTEPQWETLAQVAAELCLRYGIAVTRQTVLGHGEVQDLLNRPQSGKWDPMVLPWMPDLATREVGDMLRDRTAQILAGLKNPVAASVLDDIETPPLQQVRVDGASLPGTRFDGRDWVDLSKLAEHFGWPAPFVHNHTASFANPVVSIAIEPLRDGDGFMHHWAEIAELSQKLDMMIVEDPSGNQALQTVIQPEQADAPHKVIVHRGQTLRKIARRWLGDASLWETLTDETGRSFDKTRARALRVGQIVLLPARATAQRTATPLASPKITAITKAIVAQYPHVVGAAIRTEMNAATLAILQACNNYNVDDPSHQAYILATANHETNLGHFMREIWGNPPTAAQQRYAHILGNTSKDDGFKYRGRGFVQITGKSNYQRYSKIFNKDFVAKPELVENKEIAAAILVRGMCELGFTKPGFVLDDLGEDGKFDFVGARALINGDKNLRGGKRYPGKTKGRGIADIALQYRSIIVAA